MNKCYACGKKISGFEDVAYRINRKGNKIVKIKYKNDNNNKKQLFKKSMFGITKQSCDKCGEEMYGFEKVVYIADKKRKGYIK